jgi:ribosome-associated toxin RatA of RatAB toxin-antitoxin module
MKRNVQKIGLISSLMTLAIAPWPLLAQTALTPDSMKRSPIAEQTGLAKGKVTVNGQDGRYISKVVVSAPLSVVWEVLTDYGDFPQFLPNVISSRVLEVKGNQKIVEQVDSRRVLIITVKSRIRTLMTETRPQRIDFRMVEGDLQQFQGYWQIEPIALAGSLSPQVLITQTIEAQPKSSVPKGIFYRVFKSSLEKHLNALRIEAERRSSRYSRLSS